MMAARPHAHGSRDTGRTIGPGSRTQPAFRISGTLPSTFPFQALKMTHEHEGGRILPRDTACQQTRIGRETAGAGLAVPRPTGYPREGSRTHLGLRPHSTA